MTARPSFLCREQILTLSNFLTQLEEGKKKLVSVSNAMAS